MNLKDRDVCICARGIVNVTIKNGDDVAGLTLFPHQCAIRIENVFEIEEAQKDEIRRLLSDYIGQSIRWAKRLIEHVVEDVESGKVLENETFHFDFNDDVEINNDLLHREVQGNGLKRTQESTMQIGDRSVRENVIMDGLPALSKKKENMMTNRIPKCIRGQKIGHSRDTKCELRSV